jgi:hypothetical protein
MARPGSSLWFLGALVGALVPGLAAQPARQPSPYAGIRGYVYDSLLTGTTLPRARLFLTGPTSKVVIADARGRFITDSLPPGSYTITFTHESWEAVGYAPQERTVELRAGTVTPLFLSSTAGDAILARICPATRTDRTGAVLGQVTDAATNRPIAGADVRVEWSETSVSRELGLSRNLRAVRPPTDSAGRYKLCGVPNDAAVLFRARANGIDGPPLELDLKERFIAIRMLTLDQTDRSADTASQRASGDAAPARGTARLKGLVRAADGSPIAEAQVLVLGVENGTRSTPSGGFQLDSLPGGTHTIEVRAIGFGRRREMVSFRPDTTVDVEVRLTRVATVLPEITVKADAGLSEFDRRRSSMAGGGHFLTQEAIERRRPLRTEDLFRGVPGFSVVPSGGFDYRVVSTRGPSMAGGQCSPDFYIDGVKATIDPQIGGGLPVNPAEVYGIESYGGAAAAPAQYTSQGGCGVVLIWTVRGKRRP